MLELGLGIGVWVQGLVVGGKGRDRVSFTVRARVRVIVRVIVRVWVRARIRVTVRVRVRG